MTNLPPVASASIFGLAGTWAGRGCSACKPVDSRCADEPEDQGVSWCAGVSIRSWRHLGGGRLPC
jgi:hypothetical protein